MSIVIGCRQGWISMVSSHRTVIARCFQENHKEEGKSLPNPPMFNLPLIVSIIGATSETQMLRRGLQRKERVTLPIFRTPGRRNTALTTRLIQPGITRRRSNFLHHWVTGAPALGNWVNNNQFQVASLTL